MNCIIVSWSVECVKVLAYWATIYTLLWLQQFEENVLKRLTSIEKLLRRPISSEGYKSGIGAPIKNEEDARYMVSIISQLLCL